MKFFNFYKKYLTVMLLVLTLTFGACNRYLDIIPDNIPTLDHAFAMRSEAEKYLYTCYSYMPKDGGMASDPAMLGGDEIWTNDLSGSYRFSHIMFNIANGRQTTINPAGEAIWVDLYKGLRDCNIFLENINRVKDMTEEERKEWIAEVKFLKAYYHFYLVRMYGPIPLVKENLPVDINVADVQISRAPVDSCFQYITQLLDEVKDDLQPTITDPIRMMGRITKPIVYALKAKVLLTAASPLFNGNKDQAALRNRDGSQLFNQVYDAQKWKLAADACKEAIDQCHDAGIKLYEFIPGGVTTNISEQLKLQLKLRNAFNERWNSEIIWANTQSIASNIQLWATPHLTTYLDNPNVTYELAVPLKIVDMFYTKNGVPINEDKTWQTNITTRVGGIEDQRLIRLNYETAESNFDREPRFYASLGFDGGVWYGHGYYNDEVPSGIYFVEGKLGQKNGKKGSFGSITGYFVKKFVHYQSTQANNGGYSTVNYPWPLIRLPHLYLMYAEALNENAGPTEEVHQYINIVRKRAGLPTIRDAWDNFATNTKYSSQAGMREIIRRETLIETAFEGVRFWDMKRWKTAPDELSRPIEGWNVFGQTTEAYYKKQLIYAQKFSMKDYFFPIRDANLLSNKNLVQNLGW